MPERERIWVIGSWGFISVVQVLENNVVSSTWKCMLTKSVFNELIRIVGFIWKCGNDEKFYSLIVNHWKIIDNLKMLHSMKHNLLLNAQPLYIESYGKILGTYLSESADKQWLQMFIKKSWKYRSRTRVHVFQVIQGGFQEEICCGTFLATGLNHSLVNLFTLDNLVYSTRFWHGWRSSLQDLRMVYMLFNYKVLK